MYTTIQFVSALLAQRWLSIYETPFLGDEAYFTCAVLHKGAVFVDRPAGDANCFNSASPECVNLYRPSSWGGARLCLRSTCSADMCLMAHIRPSASRALQLLFSGVAPVYYIFNVPSTAQQRPNKVWLVAAKCFLFRSSTQLRTHDYVHGLNGLHFVVIIHASDPV